MKAWLVREKDEFRATVVFAETRGKARAIAMRTDACEDADFCDIEVTRKQQLDKYYSDGKTEMDWFNAKDRIVLVKECGFRCDSEAFDIDDCEICPAKEYCGLYEAEKEALDDMWEYIHESQMEQDTEAVAVVEIDNLVKENDGGT